MWDWPPVTSGGVAVVTLAAGLVFWSGWLAHVAVERRRLRRMQAQFMSGLEAKFQAMMAGRHRHPVILSPGFGPALGVPVVTSPLMSPGSVVVVSTMDDIRKPAGNPYVPGPDKPGGDDDQGPA